VQNNRKRIVIDATPFLFPYTGIGRVTRTLCKTLFSTEQPYEFVFYSRKFGIIDQSMMDQGKRLYHFPFPQFAEKLMESTGLIEKITKGEIFHATDHYMPLKNPEKAMNLI